MAVDQKKAQQYIDEVIKALAENPASLTDEEKRLGHKCVQGEQHIRKLVSTMDEIKKQMEQGQAQLASLKTQLENAQGRVNGFVELLVEAKFPEMGRGNGGALPPGAEKTGEKEVPTLNRAQRREAAAKARKDKKEAKKETKTEPAEQATA